MAHAVEETGEIGLRRQMLERGTLEPVQGDMGRVEIDRVDQRRRAREIGKHVAAAGCDRHHAVAGPQVHRRHVDLGVLPDLGVDEAGKKQREEPLGDPVARQGAMPVESTAETPVPAGADCGG